MKIKSQTPRCFKTECFVGKLCPFEFCHVLLRLFLGKFKPFFVPNNMNLTALRGNPEITLNISKLNIAAVKEVSENTSIYTVEVCDVGFIP